MSDALRSLLPRSLFGRALLILMVPIVVLQLVVGSVFFQRHYQRITEQMTRTVASELAYTLDRVENIETEAAIRRELARLQAPLNYPLRFSSGARVVPGVRRELVDISGRQVARALAEVLDRPFSLDLLSNSRSVHITLPVAGGALEAVVPRSRMTASNPHQLLVLMVLAALMLSGLAVVFLRNQVRPIRRLAEAAEAFGKGRSEPFRPAGAEEVRRAGAAFLSMRARLERQIEQRTQMLSGVSHDLRTPLTRMKLTLAMLEECEDVRHLRRDVDEMERMIGEFLAFARGSAAEEPEPADPFALAEAVADAARRAGAEVAVVRHDEAQQDGAVLMRPGAIGRALQNLVGNAVQHGSRATLTVRLLRKTVDFIVEDDGPGIPEEDRARAMQPFTRLDAARNLDAGGSVGLGLTIALDIALSHGGSLELGQSAELGGLRAVLRVPR